MTNVAILCSGQGAQGPGMFELFAGAPEAAPVFAAAKAALGGRDARDLVETAGEDELRTNKVGQILCCTQAMAAWAALRDSVPPPFLVAGYSVGELAAWGVAGIFSAEQVLRLAERRAALMDAATKEPSGLLAVRGLAQGALEALCREHGCSPAIRNGPDRILVGGSRASLGSLASDAEARGASTQEVGVAVAAHTPALRGAGEQFHAVLRDELADADKDAPSAGPVPAGIRLLSGIDGRSVAVIEEGLKKLARQIGQTIDWAACMDSCRSAGVTKVVELGPGDALARLLQPVIPDGDIHGQSRFRSSDGLKRWLATKRSG